MVSGIVESSIQPSRVTDCTESVVTFDESLLLVKES